MKYFLPKSTTSCSFPWKKGRMVRSACWRTTTIPYFLECIEIWQIHVHSFSLIKWMKFGNQKSVRPQWTKCDDHKRKSFPILQVFWHLWNFLGISRVRLFSKIALIFRHTHGICRKPCCNITSCYWFLNLGALTCAFLLSSSIYQSSSSVTSETLFENSADIPAYSCNLKENLL